MELKKQIGKLEATNTRLEDRSERRRHLKRAEVEAKKFEPDDANLSYEDLTDANLSHANLSYANLDDANLSYEDLTDANLSYAKLSHANLSYADLSYAKLSHAYLTGADLVGAKLAYAYLTDADLVGADLTDANLSHADLVGANLAYANLDDANLAYANLDDANLSGAKGLLSASDWLAAHFESTEAGYYVWKMLESSSSRQYKTPDYWRIEPGSVFCEIVNPSRTTECGCGVNFGTRSWCERTYPDQPLWKCLLAWRDLPDVVVPYNTDGKARCARLTLLDRAEVEAKGQPCTRFEGRP